MAFLTWSKGGEADVLACDDDKVTLLSTTPSAPGSRPEGATAAGEVVKVKVARCKKVEGGFAIEGRLLDATRALREIVASAKLPS